MRLADLHDILEQDAARGNVYNVRRYFLKSFFNAGVSSVMLYRFQTWLVFKSILSAKIVSRLNLIFNGSDFVIGSRIGPGLIINHPIGIVVGNKVVAGNNLTLMQGVTLGQLSFESSTDSETRNPIIGNNVSIGALAVVLGGVTIGDNCLIGAGTVVLRDVPSGHTAVGNPARLIVNR